VKQDVLGLDVPMDHVLAVGVVECAGDLGRDADGVRHRELLFPGDQVADGLPLDVRHHVEEEAVGLAAVEQREDVGVLEVGGGLDLGEEPLGADHGGEFRAQHLDRHLAVVPQVLGPPAPSSRSIRYRSARAVFSRSRASGIWVLWRNRA
jgi:hypothetical protein